MRKKLFSKKWDNLIFLLFLSLLKCLLFVARVESSRKKKERERDKEKEGEGERKRRKRKELKKREKDRKGFKLK